MPADNLSAAEIGNALIEFNNAITSTNAVNGALAREDLQSGLVVAGPMETPLRNRLNRIEGNGTAHAFYRLKPNADHSQGVFYGTTPGNAVFPKGGLPIDTTENYDYTAVPYANLGDVAQVTFQDQVQGRSFTNLMDLRTRIKAKNVAMMEEYFLWNGDSSVIQPGGGRIFDGLLKQIANLGGNVQISPDGTIGVGAVRQLQQKQVDAGGTPRVVFTDTLGKSILTAQIAQFYAIRGMGQALSDMTAGISVGGYDFGYGENPLLWDRYLVPDPYSGQRVLVSLDDQTTDGANDGNVIQMVDVDALHSVDLAIVGTAWRKVIYETTALMLSVPQYQGMITGLTYAGQSPNNGVNHL